MYNYQDFKQRFDVDHINKTLLDMAIKLTPCYVYSTTDLMKGLSGDSWEMLACIDRLEELGKLRCINNTGSRNNWKYIAR
jgi:hypothetical protein